MTCITNILCFRQGHDSRINYIQSHIEIKLYMILGYILLSILRCGYSIHNTVFNPGDGFQSLKVAGLFLNEMESCI